MTNLTGIIMLRPLLNCKEQEDPMLIQSIRFLISQTGLTDRLSEKCLFNYLYVRNDFLDPPGTGDYEFENPNPPTVADGQPLLLDQVFFITMHL